MKICTHCSIIAEKPKRKSSQNNQTAHLKVCLRPTENKSLFIWSTLHIIYYIIYLQFLGMHLAALVGCIAHCMVECSTTPSLFFLSFGNVIGIRINFGGIGFTQIVQCTTVCNDVGSRCLVSVQLQPGKTNTKCELLSLLRVMS